MPVRRCFSLPGATMFLIQRLHSADRSHGASDGSRRDMSACASSSAAEPTPRRNDDDDADADVDDPRTDTSGIDKDVRNASEYFHIPRSAVVREHLRVRRQRMVCITLMDARLDTLDSHARHRWRALAAAALIVTASTPALTQQYITDDAAIMEHRACQVQMWHGERSSWVLPVCTPTHNLELSVGFIAVWRDGADKHFEYVLQAKTLFKPLTVDGWGAGFVAGVGRDPALASTSPRVASYYAYVPLSLSLAHDRVMLHQNTGVIYQASPGANKGALT